MRGHADTIDAGDGPVACATATIRNRIFLADNVREWKTDQPGRPVQKWRQIIDA